jgi:DNA-directed RNA polymerase II subunit RPB1
MNLHMPQDPESEAELRNLAAIPYQIISPGNNTPIIGIFQDSMLGSYQFTRENVVFTKRDAMNLLMMCNRINENTILEKEGPITSFDIMSQIIPPLSLYYKTKLFKEGDDVKTSNGILEIKNGEYIRGQIDKGVVGSGTKGLIHRICNDFGNIASAQFIDDLQNVVTSYLKTAGFSVGISDLIINDKTKTDIITTITNKKIEVKNLLDRILLGVFDNNTGKSNVEEFETEVDNIMKKAFSDSEKIIKKKLAKDNRFSTMVAAGSKGSDLNISFMISCLGQQNVDGKRIPYGFENRTLPHYTKFDDSPVARGFVENCYINGLSPQELFFHAMGGRVGLIDTAVKTSTTGYIQRRLIKGLEDLMVNYDMTIRTNKGKIVQFQYGEDGIDTTKVENQILPLVNMSIQEIYAHYNLLEEAPGKTKTISTIFLKNTLARHKKQATELMAYGQKYTDLMIDMRKQIVDNNVLKKKDEIVVNSPVAFQYIIQNVQGQLGITSSSLVDITIVEAFQLVEQCYEKLDNLYYSKPTLLFKTLFFFYLSPKELLVVKRLNKAALVILLEKVITDYKKAIVAPGEMVGLIAGQSIGEISTQMTLNTFHFAGVASKSNVTRGVPRIEEILSLSPEPKNQSLTVFLREEDEQNKDRAMSLMYMLEHTRLEEIVKAVKICFDPDDLNTLIQEDRALMEQYKAFESMVEECATSVSVPTEEGLQPQPQPQPQDNMNKSNWVIRLEMDPETMLEKNITMDDVHFTLNTSYDNQISCVYSDYNADNLVFRIRLQQVVKEQKASSKKKAKPLDQTDEIYVLKNFQENLLQNVILRGVKGINKVILRKIKDNMVEKNGVYSKQDIWVLDTVGTNLLDVLALDYVDSKRTFSNNIMEVFNVLGIEAARNSIYNELVDVVEFDGTYVNYHNYSVLVDRMTFNSRMISIFRHGINSDDIGPIAKASFEETPEMFLKAARHGELDNMKGISANVMCGQEGFFGTSAFQVFLDLKEMQKLSIESEYVEKNIQSEIDAEFGFDETGDNDTCSKTNLSIQNNVLNIKKEEVGIEESEGYSMF